MTVNRFVEHPNSVGESYSQHLRAAFGYSWRMFKGAACCALHGLMPWLCTTSGSALIRELNAELDARCALALKPSEPVAGQVPAQPKVG